MRQANLYPNNCLKRLYGQYLTFYHAKCTSFPYNLRHLETRALNLIRWNYICNVIGWRTIIKQGKTYSKIQCREEFFLACPKFWSYIASTNIVEMRNACIFFMNKNIIYLSIHLHLRVIPYFTAQKWNLSIRKVTQFEYYLWMSNQRRLVQNWQWIFPVYCTNVGLQLKISKTTLSIIMKMDRLQFILNGF